MRPGEAETGRRSARAGRLRALAFLVALLSCGGAWPLSDLSGDWLDNAADNARIGNLTFTKDTIRIGHVVSYSVTGAGPFGSGQLFKVIKANRYPDPMGCGPNGKVSYIVVQPLADSPGTRQQAMRLIFYGGTVEPDAGTIDADPAVCEVHPFGRLPPGGQERLTRP